MQSVVNMFNTIVINFKCNKKSFNLKCSKNNTKYLDLLNQLNILEYSSVKNLNGVYSVRLMYYKGIPNLHSIVLLNTPVSKGFKTNYLKKEFNSKKSIYIVNSSNGLKIVDNVDYCSNVSTILFKVNVS